MCAVATVAVAFSHTSQFVTLSFGVVKWLQMMALLRSAIKCQIKLCVTFMVFKWRVHTGMMATVERIRTHRNTYWNKEEERNSSIFLGIDNIHLWILFKMKCRNLWIDSHLYQSAILFRGAGTGCMAKAHLAVQQRLLHIHPAKVDEYGDERYVPAVGGVTVSSSL